MIVSNTGPLIALGKVDHLNVLEQLFGSVHIPPTVHRELLAKPSPEGPRLDEALTHFVQVVPTPTFAPEVRLITQRLGAGEQEAIALAYQLKTPLLIDDQQGGAAAKRLGLPAFGTVGVLIRAKEANLVSAIRPVLEQIRRQGYWLSDEVLNAAAKLAGE